MIIFFNVPKTSFFHVLGYFGHISFLVLEGVNIFGRVAKGGEKFDASLLEAGAKNFGPPIVLDSLGVS